MQIAGLVARALEIAHCHERRAGGRIQICGAADQRGKCLIDHVQYCAGRGAGRDAFRVCLEGRNVAVPALRQFAHHPLLKFFGTVGGRFRVL